MRVDLGGCSGSLLLWLEAGKRCSETTGWRACIWFDHIIERSKVEGWSVGLLVGRLAVWSVGWLVGRLVLVLVLVLLLVLVGWSAGAGVGAGAGAG